MQDSRQTTTDVFLVRPSHFGSNPETAESNAFQKSVYAVSRDQVLAEFDAFVDALDSAGARPIVFDDTVEPIKPDAVFPNNWFSSHSDGTVFLYPMEAVNRRAERRLDIVESLSLDHGFNVREIVDLSSAESDGHFLEGTGSMVLDRANRLIYAALSSRTHMDLLAEFAQRVGYEITAFDATDSSGRAIYHTNVMMAIGTEFAVICAESIADRAKRDLVVARLEAGNRAVVDITMQQMAGFAGNMLELASSSGDALIVLSRSAEAVLTAGQRDTLARFGRLLPVSIDTIEAAGGGSVRCMLAEIFLPKAGDATANGRNA